MLGKLPPPRLAATDGDGGLLFRTVARVKPSTADHSSKGNGCPARSDDRAGRVRGSAWPALTEKPYRIVVPALAIAVLTFVVYIPALGNGFVWDDDQYVTENETLRTLDGLRQIWLEPGATPQYYPATYSTFWIEYQLWQLHPFGYHLVNVVLHSIVAALLGIVLRRLSIPGAWLAAAVFAVHPVHVESVAWITERKNVLSGVFYLSSILAYLRFARMDCRPYPVRRAWSSYVLALLLFAVALLSKTAIVTLPAVLVLLLWWKRDRLRWGDVLPVVPLFVLAAGMSAVTVWVEARHVGAQGEEWTLSMPGRCLLAGRILWFYLGKLIWPTNLTYIYYRWQIDVTLWWQYLFPLGAVAGLVVLWLYRGRIGRVPLVAALYFAGTLAPVLGFFNVYFMRYSYVADHFQYIASIGPIVAFAALAGKMLRRPARPARRRSGPTPATLSKPGVRWVIPGVYLAILGTLAWNQQRAYKNAETLWRDTLAKNPSAWMAHNNLGNLLIDQGKLEEALEHLTRAVELKPDFAEAHGGKGIILARMGRLDEAIKHFRARLEFRRGTPMAHTNLALALARKGVADEAYEHFTRALALDGDFIDAHQGLGILLARQGRAAEAVAHFHAVARLRSDDAEAHYNLGNMLARLGRTEEAAAAFRRTLEIAPSHVGARRALSALRAPRQHPDD